MLYAALFWIFIVFMGCYSLPPSVRRKSMKIRHLLLIALTALWLSPMSAFATAHPKHCDIHKTDATHDCAKHCAEHPGVKDEACAKHCAKEKAASAHVCDGKHCETHVAAVAKGCTTTQCMSHPGKAAHVCDAAHCAKHGGNMADCCGGSEQRCDV